MGGDERGNSRRHRVAPLSADVTPLPRLRELAGFADAVDRRASRLLKRLLDTTEAIVDGAPTRIDQVDEQSEVVHARAALGEQFRFDPLQAPDRLVREAAHLGKLPGHGPRFDPDPVADGLAHAVRKARLELGGGRRERFDLRSGPLEGGLDVARLGLPGLGFCEPLAGAIEGAFIHEGDDSVSAG